jgi:hypothetical protein
LENLPAFLEAHAENPKALEEAPKENGSPHTIIVAGAGLRAADLVRYNSSHTFPAFGRDRILTNLVEPLENTRQRTSQ